MRIEDYGFKGTLQYRKAEFTGSNKRREWSRSSSGSITLTSELQIRNFLRQHDLADLLILKLEFGYHGASSFSVCYQNIFLAKLRDGQKAFKQQGVSRAAVSSQIDNGIKASRIHAKKLQEALSSHHNRYSAYVRQGTLRGQTRYYRAIDEYAIYYNTVDFYAIPVALKKNRTKFKKEGPKPDPIALYYKRHQSWG